MIDIPDIYSWDAFHKEGDIILVFSGGIGSRLNTRIQSLLRGRKAHFSHVMLCVAPGLYAHSITKSGVTYEFAEQYPISTIATRFRVFRHRPLCKDLNSLAQISTAAAYHTKKRYNWLLIIPLLRRYFQKTVFCSEFVCRVFSSLDPQYHLTPNPLFTLPIDVERKIANDSDWEDVTGQYIEADNAYAASHQNFYEPLSRTLFFCQLTRNIKIVNTDLTFFNELISLNMLLKQHLLMTKNTKKIINPTGLQEPPSNTHYCISLYEAAIDYHKVDSARNLLPWAPYQPLIWYAPTHDQVSSIYSSFDETVDGLHASTYADMSKTIHTLGRILSATLWGCLEWLSNTTCNVSDDKEGSRKMLIEGALKTLISMWLKEAGSEGYRSAVLSIIEELQKTFHCHEPDAAVPSTIMEVYGYDSHVGKQADGRDMQTKPKGYVFMEEFLTKAGIRPGHQPGYIKALYPMLHEYICDALYLQVPQDRVRRTAKIYR